MIQIQEFEAAYTESVIQLILNIQQNEFGVPITINDQQDLLTIESFYKKDNGNFWIALSDNKLIATIALIDIGNGEGTLRKMFVDQNFRGQQYGVAKLLLATLFSWAAHHQIHSIYLGTTEVLKASHRFYEKNNFLQIPKQHLPVNFPLMQVDTRFYKYVLV